MFVSFSFCSMRHGNRVWQHPQVRRLIGENAPDRSGTCDSQRAEPFAAFCHIQVGDQREVTARRDTLIWVNRHRCCPSRAVTLTAASAARTHACDVKVPTNMQPKALGVYIYLISFGVRFDTFFKSHRTTLPPAGQSMHLKMLKTSPDPTEE